MNLIDALRTGRPLRRPVAKHLGSSGKGWLGNEWVKSLLIISHSEQCNLATGQSRYTITEEDLLADDWEVEPKQITLTINDLADAWKKACLTLPPYRLDPSVGELAKALGLLDNPKT